MSTFQIDPVRLSEVAGACSQRMEEYLATCRQFKNAIESTQALSGEQIRQAMSQAADGVLQSATRVEATAQEKFQFMRQFAQTTAETTEASAEAVMKIDTQTPLGG